MGFLKNAAIKRFSKKRATIFLNGIAETLNENEEMQPSEALIAYIKKISDYESIVPVYPNASYSLYEIFSEFLENLEEDGEVAWDTIVVLWTAKVVFNELSYDSSIGTREDLKLVGSVVRNLIEQWCKKYAV